MAPAEKRCIMARIMDRVRLAREATLLLLYVFGTDVLPLFLEKLSVRAHKL